MIAWLLVPLAYLFGSISSAIIVCRLMGYPDPRGEGSGNPGATNVMRIAGKKAAAITLAGDALKGMLPVILIKVLDGSELQVALVMLAAFLGHLYPLFFGFKGGKGVATAFGLSLGLHWQLGLLISGTWYCVYKLGKISSLAALVSAILAPIYAWLIVKSMVAMYTYVFISAILIWRHKSNIQKLLAGQEK